MNLGLGKDRYGRLFHKKEEWKEIQRAYSTTIFCIVNLVRTTFVFVGVTSIRSFEIGLGAGCSFVSIIREGMVHDVRSFFCCWTCPPWRKHATKAASRKTSKAQNICIHSTFGLLFQFGVGEIPCSRSFRLSYDERAKRLLRWTKGWFSENTKI